MTTVFLAFILLALVILAMSVGVLLGRKPIKGSCGGVGAALGEKNYHCDICGGDRNKCDEPNRNNLENITEKSIFYDANDKS